MYLKIIVYLCNHKSLKNILKTMTKAEIVANISKETGIESKKVLAVVEALMVTIKDTIANDEDIFLRGFGTFTTKTRKEKIGRLIKENKSVIVPEHKIPYFKPADVFKDALLK